MEIQIIEADAVVNTATLPAGSTIAVGGASATLPNGQTWTPGAGLTIMSQAGATVGWTLASGVLTRPSASIPALSILQPAALAAVSSAAAAIVTAIEPDPTHKAAFDNAAMIVAGNAGAAPSSGPFVSAFDAAAADYGVSATQFAALLTTGLVESQTLSIALNVAEAAIAAATASSAIAVALASFETAIVAVVAALNAVLPTPISAPPAIVITGVNA